MTWSALDLRQLATLRAVAASGSFRAAALRLGYAQSAVSHHIAALEETLGQTLVTRSPGNRRVTLTAAGDMLLAHAEDLISRAQAAQADLELLRNGGGRVRVGAEPAIATRVGPPLLARLAAHAPHLDVTIVDRASDRELLAELEDGMLDLAFATFPLPHGPFHAIEALEDPFVLVVPADAPLARVQSVTVHDLRELPLARRRGGTPVETRLLELGVTPDIVFESDHDATLLAFVAGGHASAILPRLAVDPTDARIAVADLAPPLRLARHVALVRHAHRRGVAAADAVATAALDVLADFTDPSRRAVGA